MIWLVIGSFALFPRFVVVLDPLGRINEQNLDV
jgi:hypothetical protein